VVKLVDAALVVVEQTTNRKWRIYERSGGNPFSYDQVIIKTAVGRRGSRAYVFFALLLVIDVPYSCRFFSPWKARKASGSGR